MSGQKDDPQSIGKSDRPRFTEIATFMRAPYSESLENLDIAMIGVPMDLGVTNRAGARHGPREIRNASSMMRSWNPSTNVQPYALAKVADVGDVPIDNLFNLDVAIEQIQAYYKTIHAAGVVPLSAGGDHSITFPILAALGANEPVGMVHIDAHLDTWGEFYGSKYHHGAPFRLAVEAGVLDPERSIQIGIRGGQNTREGYEFSRSHGMRVITMDEFVDLGVAAVIAEARRSLAVDRPTLHSMSMASIPCTRLARVRPRSRGLPQSTRCSCYAVCVA